MWQGNTGFCERCTANVRQVTAKYLSGENEGLSGATPQPKVAEKMPTQLWAVWFWQRHCNIHRSAVLTEAPTAHPVLDLRHVWCPRGGLAKVAAAFENLRPTSPAPAEPWLRCWASCGMRGCWQGRARPSWKPRQARWLRKHSGGCEACQPSQALQPCCPRCVLHSRCQKGFESFCSRTTKTHRVPKPSRGPSRTAET